MQRSSFLETAGKYIIGLILVTSLGDPAALAQQTDAIDAARKGSGDSTHRPLGCVHSGGPRGRDDQSDQVGSEDRVALTRSLDRQEHRDGKDRLERIRAALRKAEDDVNIHATKVTIHGKGIRLSEALQQLQKQSGNAITDMREQLGAEVTNPALDLSLTDKTFFEALDEVVRQGQVATTFFER